MSVPDLERLIDCVAVSSALDGLLVYGASGSQLESLADRLARGLLQAGAEAVDRVWLGAAESEDLLWGVADLPQGWNGRGLLVPPPNTTRIVIVPDLARLSLAAARAGVTMLGASHVRIERRGRSSVVPVHHRWIASLPDATGSSVSRHLVDRFPVRIRMPVRPIVSRLDILREALTHPEQRALPGPSQGVRERGGARIVTDEAIEQTMSCMASNVSGNVRESLALLEVAKALALLDAKPSVDANTVREAARLLDLGKQSDRDEAAADSAGASATPSSLGASADFTRPDPMLVTPVDECGASNTEPNVRLATAGDALLGTDSQIDGADAPAGASPQAETLPPHEYASLRMPWRLAQVASSGRGTIIGTRRAETTRDLAIVDTLFAAAPMQSLRRAALEQPPTDIILRRSDLRSYRRVPLATELFVLVIDYTSVVDREWLDSLIPFLRHAYAARAKVCVIKVGAKDATNPLRAERVLARNVLVPGIAALLDAPAGSATPLADGLSLALQAIQQSFGHGRVAARRATLVVVTDGRGNVTLKASREGCLTERVGRQGIEDARSVARDLRALTHTKRVLINPGPTLLRDLPLALAAALDAEIVRVTDHHG
ncbi:hypothetical protein [Peristeroidobacter soli]|uniref:hypothetical protein n=1 Tax=Peristeroidobacter soli TaxID=2497877 RepID=UPI00101CB381|nr:hypothetical protein [Peristeroidobacter soli]